MIKKSMYIELHTEFRRSKKIVKKLSLSSKELMTNKHIEIYKSSLKFRCTLCEIAKNVLTQV